jgi:hypothetical protein
VAKIEETCSDDLVVLDMIDRHAAVVRRYVHSGETAFFSRAVPG